MIIMFSMSMMIDGDDDANEDIHSPSQVKILMTILMFKMIMVSVCTDADEYGDIVANH